MKDQMRITDSELAIIKGLFAENDDALKLMRKVFLPEYDPNAPLNQIIDLWLSVNFEDKTPDEKIVLIEARSQVIKHIEACLSQLKFLAGTKEESVEATKARLFKNSNK